MTLLERSLLMVMSVMIMLINDDHDYVEDVVDNDDDDHQLFQKGIDGQSGQLPG